MLLWLWITGIMQVIYCGNLRRKNAYSRNMPRSSAGEGARFLPGRKYQNAQPGRRSKDGASCSDAYQEGIDAAFSDVQQFAIKFIITLLGGRQAFRKDVFCSLAKFAHLQLAFEEESAKVLSLKDKLREIENKKSLKLDGVVRETKHAFRELYDLTLESLRGLSSKCSYRLAADFEFPEFDGALALGPDEFSKLSRVLSREDGSRICEAGSTSKTDESILFSVYMVELMDLVEDRYSDNYKVRGAKQRISLLLQGLDGLDGPLESLRGSNKRLSSFAEEQQEDGDLEVVECVRKHIVENYRAMAELEAQKAILGKEIAKNKRTIRDVIEKSNHSEHNKHLNAGFYVLFRDKICELCDKMMISVFSPKAVLGLIYDMRLNLLSLVKHARTLESPGLNESEIFARNNMFINDFRESLLIRSHGRIISCRNAITKRLSRL